MKYFKILLLVLLLLALIQFIHYGVEDCDRCKFDGKGITSFFNLYSKECLSGEVDLNINNMTILNWTDIDSVK